MKHRIFLTIGIGSGFSFWLYALARGYFADPALLVVLVPLPLLALLLYLITVSVSIGYCIWLLFVRKTRRNVGLALAALIGALILVVGPRLLNDYDGFVYRMESYSEAEFQRLAADTKAAFDERGLTGLNSYLEGEDRRVIIESLADAHPILTISEFPLDIGASDERVHLEWASGLTGGYKAVISLRPDPPSEWAGPAGPGKPGPYQIMEITYIYDGVALLHLP